jgi:hypothetical protein
MDIIFGKDVAEQLRERYTVLELETLTAEDGRQLEAYCVIPGEKLSVNELPQLDQWIKLHDEFLRGYHNKEYTYCRDCVDYLMGKFGGELDTFYEEILRRINEAEAVKSE